MKNAGDNQDLENQLVCLLGYDLFDLIKTLRTNRQMILYCTLLASAQSAAEKAKIEGNMRSDPELTWILNALSETDRTESNQVRNKIFFVRQSFKYFAISFQEGVTRTASVKRARDDDDSESMEVNNGSKDNSGSAHHVVNLEDLAFAQGSHFMTNKSCRLPDGSYRLQKKGYEEVHVPALKPTSIEAGEVRFNTLRFSVVPLIFSYLLELSFNHKFTKICSSRIRRL